MDWGREAQHRLQDIATLSAPGAGVTRFPFTQEHADARDKISQWMNAAGLKTRLDAACTLIGRREGPPGSPTFLIGSHQDSVLGGGAYDGIMGVALGCLALEKLAADGITLPFAVEVLAFADEEGVRFPTALIGPRALAGTLDDRVLDMCDQDGVTLAGALNSAGGDAAAIAKIARSRSDILGYLEAHIEQGPLLESEDLPLGIVTGICGIERNTVTFTGATGHAGTVPMNLRQDALVAAAHLIAEVDRLAATDPNIRATVGRIENHPNVVNGIPREVTVTVEIRGTDDAIRQRFAGELKSFCAEISCNRRIDVSFERTYEQTAVSCDEGFRKLLAGACEAEGIAPRELPSGATHDASAMADLCPIAMLFTRCRGGISHSPEEFATDADMGQTVTVMARFLQDLAAHIADQPEPAQAAR